MKFARWVFIIAGVYGIIVVTPLYFSEYQIGLDYPPAITHPEYFYGFIGVVLAFQILFLVIAINPVRYRMIILPAIVEKFSYAIALFILFAQQRIPVMILSGGIIDFILGILFLTAFFKSKEKKELEFPTLNSSSENK
ncbi:MAG: hypothetical protein AB1521_03880 [Bacteroidota bacterium]